MPARHGLIDITAEVQTRLSESQIEEGVVLVNPRHITASVFVNDDERGLHHGYEQFLEALMPHEPFG